MQTKKKREGTVFRNGIARRWLLNSLGVMILLLAACITALSFVVQSYAYNGIQMTLVGRSDELPTVLSSSMKTVNEFNAAARSYTENFPDKNLMEVMAVSRAGKILSTSTGFAPDQAQTMPDYEDAMHASSGYGYWIGKLTSGEKVMAITRVVRGANGAVLGAVRYVVSMERADRQITFVVLCLVGIGILIIALVTLSGLYFVRSIVKPIRELNATAEKIAQGNFDVRVKKDKNDEIGALCESINDMAAELGAAEKMKNDFISSVSHELRTPITSVKSYAETLEGEPEMPEETRQRFLGVILNESDRMTKIVQDLLTLSRFDAGSIEFSFDYFSFEKSVKDVYNATRMEAQAHGHEFSLELEIPLPKIRGDKARVEQVLMNMVSNAIKYTKDGGRISMTAGWKDSEVWCTVKDNGIGIPQEDAAKVFDRFYRVDKARSRESGGTGLGLSIAHEIVVRHGGRIDLQSRLGKGTRITVWLPVEGPKDA